MGHYKLLFFVGVSLSMAATGSHTLAETSRGKTPPQSLNERAAPQQPTRQLQPLIRPLIHFPDHMVSAGFAASANPAQIALAARYLNEPASVAGDPDFDQSTLTLMQYPALLGYMAANLMWVSELGHALTIHEPEQLWTALADERLAPAAAGEPIRVARTTRYVVQPSRPTHTSSRHLPPTYHEVGHYPDRRIKRYRVKHGYVAPLRHQRIWRDTGFYDIDSRRHGSGHPSNHRFRNTNHHPNHHPNHRLKHWRLGVSYGHQPRYFSHHRGFNDDWLFAHQRRLEGRILRKQHAYSHREHKREHRRENRRDHRRDGRWDRHNYHKQERQHRREHRQENRHEYGQQHRQERRQEPREHDTSHRRSTPKRDRPKEWMFAQGPLR